MDKHLTFLFVPFAFVFAYRYITTFYIRRNIDFGSFKRDVLLFKTIALIQLFYCYLFPGKSAFAFDPISVAMIASGYVVSMLATNAIGIDRTYFAAELGLVEPKWISKFPYGYIPHPMIVSQMWALLGFYKAQHFRVEAPYVIQVHLALCKYS
jgi:Phospholipid methyltransferase